MSHELSVELGRGEPSVAEDGRVCERVVSAVASELGVDSTTLDPLYDVVDPDALEALFRPGRRTAGERSDRVTFTFNGCEVTVRGDGAVSATAMRG